MVKLVTKKEVSVLWQGPLPGDERAKKSTIGSLVRHDHQKKVRSTFLLASKQRAPKMNCFYHQLLGHDKKYGLPLKRDCPAHGDDDCNGDDDVMRVLNHTVQWYWLMGEGRQRRRWPSRNSFLFPGQKVPHHHHHHYHHPHYQHYQNHHHHHHHNICKLPPVKQ